MRTPIKRTAISEKILDKSYDKWSDIYNHSHWGEKPIYSLVVENILKKAGLSRDPKIVAEYVKSIRKLKRDYRWTNWYEYLV